MLPGKPGSAPPPSFRRKPGFQLRLRRVLHVRYFSCCAVALSTFTPTTARGLRRPFAACDAQLASQRTALSCKTLHAGLRIMGQALCS